MLFLVIFILTLASGFVFTWWVGAIIAFVAAIIAGKTPGRSFLSGFLAIALAWMLLALFKSIPNDHILAGRVAAMVQLPGWIWVLIVTCLIGGLVGGFSALSGLFIKHAFQKS
jgi:hypothetical protein